MRFAWPQHLTLCENIPVTAGVCGNAAPLNVPLCVPLQVSPSPSSSPGPSGSCTTTMRSEPDCSHSPFSFLSQLQWQAWILPGRAEMRQNTWKGWEDKKDNVLLSFITPSGSVPHEPCLQLPSAALYPSKDK